MKSATGYVAAAFGALALLALLAVLLDLPGPVIVVSLLVALILDLVCVLAVRRWAAFERSLIHAAQKVAVGQMSARVPTTPGGTGGNRLVQAFNQMAEALERRIAATSQEQGRLIAALNSSTDAIIAVDGEGAVTFANTAALGLLKPDAGQVLGRPLAWLLADKEVIEGLRVSSEEGRPSARLVERPGKRWLQVMTSPIVGGGDWASLVVFRDVSEVKRTEQVRTDFVANVSHELRTPLAALKAVIETLEGGAARDPDVAGDFFSRADAEVDRLVAMVEELLELSRIESGEQSVAYDAVDLTGILRRAVERLRPEADKRQVNLSLRTDGPLPAVQGDSERLERAVINVIQNGLKFTPAGGSVLVAAATLDAEVRIRIADSGVGIAREHLARVFERFYKGDRARHQEGSGLGLALVKHTIEAHGGTVTAESEPGRGSVFILTLPAG